MHQRRSLFDDQIHQRQHRFHEAYFLTEGERLSFFHRTMAAAALSEALTWHEAPLGSALMSSTESELAEAVCSSRSVIIVPDFCTPEEVTLLVKAGVRAAEQQMQNPLTSSESRFRIEVFGRRLVSNGVTLTSLDRDVQVLATDLVYRALDLIQSRNPVLADGMRISGCTADTRLSYSAGEPAINVYYAPGGDFKPHRDMQSLTLLVSLSPLTDYEGGGTHFYEPAATPSEAIRGKAVPIATLRQPAGAALLWGGELTHAAAAVTKGRRLVFVASVTPQDV